MVAKPHPITWFRVLVCVDRRYFLGSSNTFIARQPNPREPGSVFLVCVSGAHTILDMNTPTISDEVLDDLGAVRLTVETAQVEILGYAVHHRLTEKLGKTYWGVVY